MAADKIHTAMDLKEAASLKDPFTAHMEAPDKEELVEIEKEMDGAFVSPRPDHERIEKLLTMQSSLGRSAHVKCTPEDEMWRSELNEGVSEMERSA